MPTHLLNRNNKALEPIGFGTNNISNQVVIKQAIEAGNRLFDSAQLYGNSDQLAKALQESNVDRSEFFISYKILPGIGKDKFLNETKSAIAKFQYLDCLLIHDLIVDDLNDLYEIIDSLKPLLASGEIRTLGVSNVNKHTLPMLLEKYPEIKIVQNKFSHVHQDIEVREICKAHGIDYIGYGLFGGREEGPCGIKVDVNEPAWNVSEYLFGDLHALARKYDVTTHQLLLVWSLMQDTIQIPSSTNVDRMRLNLNAMSILERMTQEDKSALMSCLRSEASTQEREILAEAGKKGDRLAYIKNNYLGADLIGYRLLDMIYKEDSLKNLIDILVERHQVENEYANIYLINVLIHFLEESLRSGAENFHKVIEQFKEILSLTKNVKDKEGIYELIISLGKDGFYEMRLREAERYLSECKFLKQNGYYNVNKVENERKPRFSVSIGIVGPDKEIYIIKDLSTSTTLKEIAELLKRRFPTKFNDEILKSFYIPHLKTKITDLDTSIVDLNIADGDVISPSKQKKESGSFLKFFHSVVSSPQSFTSAERVSTHKRGNSSGI